MNENPKMLDFVKAMSDADRLRIIGVLARTGATSVELAAQLGMPPQDAIEHLSFMESVGVVHKTGDKYELDQAGLEALSKKQFADQKRESYIPAPGLEEHARKVLVNHLNLDGTIRQIPSQARKLRVILDYLVTAFTPGVDYTEKEVNTILRRFHLDTAGLRRDLVDVGLLARESDGSRYWRPA
ncbi:MAG TPA: DUF2087 domain-containing protein [Anaerolineales bacterium]